MSRNKHMHQIRAVGGGGGGLMTGSVVEHMPDAELSRGPRGGRS